MSDNFWDDEDLSLGDFVRFLHKGDKVSGVILDLAKVTFKDSAGRDKNVPQLTIEQDGSEGTIILTAGQYELRKRLLEERPVPGDHIYVELMVEPKPGVAKVFNVVVIHEPPF